MQSWEFLKLSDLINKQCVTQLALMKNTAAEVISDSFVKFSVNCHSPTILLPYVALFLNAEYSIQKIIFYIKSDIIYIKKFNGRLPFIRNWLGI